MLTGENVTDDMELIDVHGYPHTMTVSHVVTILKLGWTSYFLAVIFNILYYKFHPMAVPMKPKSETHCFGEKFRVSKSGIRR